MAQSKIIEDFLEDNDFESITEVQIVQQTLIDGRPRNQSIAIKVNNLKLSEKTIVMLLLQQSKKNEIRIEQEKLIEESELKIKQAKIQIQKLD
jgi:hypothetical protein